MDFMANTVTAMDAILGAAELAALVALLIAHVVGWLFGGLK